MNLITLSAIACLVSLLFCRVLIMIAPKDAPDGGRKQQGAPVPTSGGLGIAAATMLSWLLFLSFATGYGYSVDTGFEQLGYHQSTLFSKDGNNHLIALSLFALGLGALDDAKTLPTKLKFSVLGLAALLTAGCGTYVDGIFLPVADAYFPLALWLGIGGTAIWIFIMMNATNFMDGSNGLAMGTVAIMIGGLGLHLFGPTELSAFGTAQHLQEAFNKILAAFGAITVAAFLGFLFWNLQGKLYAGDAGSLFGGAIFACLGIYAADGGNIWMPATLALPFLVDVFMTLFWRAVRGENLLLAHRDHAYQGLIKSGWSHIKTALLWWSFGLICAGAALWAAADSLAMSAYVFFGLLGLGCALWLIHRRRAPKEASQAG